MPLPLQFYLSNSAEEITAGVLGTQVVLDGSLEVPWGIDAGGLKGEPDFVFSYGTSGGTFQGNVVYVVPEPAILALLAAGTVMLALWRRRWQRRPDRQTPGEPQGGSRRVKTRPSHAPAGYSIHCRVTALGAVTRSSHRDLETGR
jgi:hypothetical protein